MFKAISIFIIAAAGLLAWQTLASREAPPCTEPLSYEIGTFDRRFGLTQADFLKAIAEAEKLWEGAVGRDLFAYEPVGEGDSGEAGLSINLIYDYRQEATEELSEIEGEVKQDRALYESLEERYRTLALAYERQKSLYDSQVALFNSRNAAYEERVGQWNAGPRNSQGELRAIEAERRALEAEYARIQPIESELNNLVRDINSLVERLNRLAKELNLNVEEYNAIGASRGETFTGGLYSSGSEGDLPAGRHGRIDIYEFSSVAKLVRVLTHELGHALGLEHIDDPSAIMYYLNKSEASKLSARDVAELKRLCGVE